jgi:hypothetical protein
VFLHLPLSGLQESANHQINITRNLPDPDHSPNQLERNNQDICENLSFWTINLESSADIRPRSIEEHAAG